MNRTVAPFEVEHGAVREEPVLRQRRVPFQVLEDDHGDSTYLGLHRFAHRHVSDREGSEAVITTLGPNELFGELAVLSNTPRTATVRAKGRMEALRFTDELFLKLATENPSIALDIMRQLSTKLGRTVEQFENMQAQLRQYARSSAP